jgi:hypothetical protein
MQLGPRAQQALMQLGPSACVSCLAVFHAKVLRLLLQLARKRERRQKRELPPSHSQCSLREELEIDTRRHQGSRGHPAGHAERCAVLSVAFLLMAQPTLSALEMIGPPRGERCDFLEVYSGCGNFTAAVFALGMVVGPAVGMVYKAGGLRSEFVQENSQALLQRLFSRKLDPAGYM